MFLRCLLGCALGLLSSNRAAAQTFTNQYSFLTGVNASGGSGSGVGALILSGNTLYGTTMRGGKDLAGTVFKIDTNGLNYTNLYTFTNGTDGVAPGSLVLAGNTLYGTAGGGSSGWGSLFAVGTNGLGFTNFYKFAHGTDGGEPSGLILVGNTLYGTANQGGAGFFGTFFRVNADGSGFLTLHSFAGQATNDGSAPSGALLFAGGTLYGTASTGGTNGSGTIYCLGTNGLGYKNLHAFTELGGIFSGGDVTYTNSDGAYAEGGLILAGSVLYGTASQGGISGGGTMFALQTNGAGFTNLYTFPVDLGNAPNSISTGSGPNAGLVLSNNTLFGTMQQNGNGLDGTVFSVTTNGDGFQVLHAFSAVAGANSTNADGAFPEAGLVLAGNRLWGTTAGGGSDGYGVIFGISGVSLNPGSGPLTVTTTALPGGAANSRYVFDLDASGGRPPYTWTFLSGVNPLEFQVGNEVYGQLPPTISTVDFTAKVTDGLGATATQALSIQVTNPDTLTLIITNVTPGMVVTNVNPPFAMAGFAIEAGPDAVVAYDGGYVAAVYYSVNHSAWLEAYTEDYFTNWFADLNLAPGHNTVSVYATDTIGAVTPTNSVAIDYVIPPSSLLTNVPGTPMASNWNPGSNPVQIDEGGAIGVTPLSLYVAPNDFDITAQAGDVVFLLDPTGGNSRTNWAAVLNFFNPSDPTGTLGLPATKYRTFFPANADSSYFDGIPLFSHVIYVPISERYSPYPGAQDLIAYYDEIGPEDGLLSGQLATFQVVAATQPSGFTATITSPYPGDQYVIGDGTLTVQGITTTTNGQAAVTNVWVQSNGGGWSRATTVNGWTNWSANVTVTTGSNSVSAYAVDQNGKVSATNTISYYYYVETPADLSLSVSAAPQPVEVGSGLIYSITISNAGPGDASDVIVSNQLPANAAFVLATGGYLPSGGILQMDLGYVTAGSTNSIQVVVQPTAAGLLTNRFQVLGPDEADPNPANNVVTIVSTVVSGTAAKAVHLSIKYFGIKSCDLADQLHRLHPGIHHQYCFTGGLGHQPTRARRGELQQHGDQRHLRRPKILPAKPIMALGTIGSALIEESQHRVR